MAEDRRMTPDQVEIIPGRFVHGPIRKGGPVRTLSSLYGRRLNRIVCLHWNLWNDRERLWFDQHVRCRLTEDGEIEFRTDDKKET
jgi:hypothetical protein